MGCITALTALLFPSLYGMDNGEKLILVGGDGHKTGQGISTIEHYEALQDFSSQYFNVKDIPYRWSAQDIVTPDNLPFVGPVTSNHPNVLIEPALRNGE